MDKIVYIKNESGQVNAISVGLWNDLKKDPECKMKEVPKPKRKKTPGGNKPDAPKPEPEEPEKTEDTSDTQEPESEKTEDK